MYAKLRKLRLYKINGNRSRFAQSTKIMLLEPWPDARMLDAKHEDYVFNTMVLVP